MSVRTCCYKDCENNSIQYVQNGSFTLFKFPKDQARRELWMELGQVNPHIPPNNLFMCSDHFDRTKYVSSNQRRNVLLGTAVPFPYVSKSGLSETHDSIVVAGNSTQLLASKIVVENCLDQDNDTYMYFDEVEVATLPDHKDEEEYQVESTIEDEDDERNIIAYRELNTDTAEQSSGEHEAESAYECGDSNTSYKVTETHAFALNKKRRMMETVSDTKKSACKQKAMKSGACAVKSSILGQHKLQCNQEQELLLPDGNNAVDSDFDESVIIDPKLVTTFIFKGEEYVQMSKEYFVQDKINMLKKLKRYEDALNSIKQKLNKLDLG